MNANLKRCQDLFTDLLRSAYDEKKPIDRELAKGAAECGAYLLDRIIRVPILGEGGLWGSFARYAKHFSEHKGTVEVTLTLKEIEQIRDSLQREWQSIETAPKDGTEVWLAAADEDPRRQRMTVAYWAGRKGWIATHEDESLAWKPSHWMPYFIPDPPQPS